MFVVLMFVCMLVKGLVVAEPSCSKFSYEESLLEKMVRTEHKFELFQAEFSALKQDVQTAVQQITDLRETIQDERKLMNERFDTKIEAFRLVINASLKEVQDENKRLAIDFTDVNKSLSTQVTDLVKETSDVFELKTMQINRMSSDIQAMYSGIYKNLTDSITTPIVGFKATGIKNKSPAKNEVLVFPTLLFNEGDMYNGDDGIFRAPVSGMYIFTVQLCSRPRHHIVVRVMVAEQELSRYITEDKNQHPCNTADAIGYMKEGEQAFVQLIACNPNSVYYDRYRIVSFSGALINKG